MFTDFTWTVRGTLSLDSEFLKYCIRNIPRAAFVGFSGLYMESSKEEELVALKVVLGFHQKSAQSRTDTLQVNSFQ